MNARLVFLVAACVAASAGCGAGEAEDDSASVEGAASSADSISRPTDTGITLEEGLWRDGKLSKSEGWRLYHFKPKTAGYYEFAMKAAPERAGNAGGLWTYLRVIDTDPEKKNPSSVDEVWVTVADNKTNLTAILVNCRANVEYHVVATTQNNSTANDLGRPNVSEGDYTISAFPTEFTFDKP